MSSAGKSILVLAFIAMAHTVSIAQFSTSSYEIGLNAGVLVYQGDLSRSFAGDYKSIRPAVGLHLSKALDPYFSLRANVMVGKVAADESKYSTPEFKKFRSFRFNTLVIELSSTVVFQVLGDNSSENSRRLSPYVFGGAGVGFVRVERDWSKLNRVFYNSKSPVQVGLALDTVRTMPKVIGVLPVGAGVRLVLAPQWALNAEGTYRFTSTDYLDGFKHSANPKNRDAYYGLSVGISYRFGGYKCPPVRN